MFRVRLAHTCVRRSLSACPVVRDALLDQLRVCSSEEQVFELVGKSRAGLDVNHVGCAVGMLWSFQKTKPEVLRSVAAVRAHPQFLTLRVLAESNVSLMDDCLLVDMLYNCHRLEVEPHDSLIQQLVLEASVRLDGLPLHSLSKFAMCISDQQLKHSRLMGRITDILARKLSTIDNAIILTTLMVSVSALVSPRLTDALLQRVGLLLDSEEPSTVTPLSVRRAVQFMRDMGLGHHRALLERCDRLLLPCVPQMKAEHMCMLLHHYRLLHFTSWQFRLAAKQRLTELIETTGDPWHFAHLFEMLYPMASPEVGERLENTALLLADEFSPLAALKVIEGLEGRRSRNHTLVNRIVSIIQKNLSAYKPVELAMITKALLVLQWKTPDLISELRACLISSLQKTTSPRHVAMLVRVLATLPRPRLDAATVARLDAVLPQCTLRDLGSLARAVARVGVVGPHHPHYQWGPSANTAVAAGPGWAYDDPPVHLLEELGRCGRRRLGAAQSAHVLLGELWRAGGEWFEETLLEPSMAALQAMSGQMGWADAAPLAHLLVDNNHLSAPLLDRIASLILADIDMIHPCSTYDILLPFALLNYDPPISDQLFDVCVQHFKPHISSFNPHELVLMAYVLVMAGRFPEQVFREIFNIDFLAKLDAFLQTMPDALNLRVRQELMAVNRALCLEYPQLKVPWFHDQYCQQFQRRTPAALPGNGSSPVRRYIHKVLSEVLGGADYTRAFVVTPYFYTIDFECVLDSQQRPVAYSKLHHLQTADGVAAQWSAETVTDELPPGAQRVAVDFLEARSFCSNSRHMMGEAVMRRRHLEIMGYRVAQIPHFEWNSMELSTEDSLKGYLKKKLFTESSSS